MVGGGCSGKGDSRELREEEGEREHWDITDSSGVGLRCGGCGYRNLGVARQRGGAF